MEIKIPSVGESVTEAVLTEWIKKDGEMVRKDDPLFVIETDKVTLEVAAKAQGVLNILVARDETIAIGAVIGTIDTSVAMTVALEKGLSSPVIEKTTPLPSPEREPAVNPIPAKIASSATLSGDLPAGLTPSVRRLIAEKHPDATKIKNTGIDDRITRGDLLVHLENSTAGVPGEPQAPMSGAKIGVPVDLPETVRKPMTPIRRRIAQRLLQAKNSTAMLTTFNDIDMSRCMELRRLYKDVFKEKHGVNLGFMSFFVTACVEALKEIPEINAFIDGGDIVYHNYQHVGVAVGTKRGLVVPVIRHAEQMNFALIEQTILDYVKKIRENHLELADLEGGTFTVTNGGIYGNLLSTPILNPPQSGILGMHRIEKKPVVVNDEIVIRPMMYIALSYDHRIVDGGQAVTFLKKIKEIIENPERIVLEV